MVAHNKPGSTAQRERWDFYPGHVKLENICYALFSLRLRRPAAGSISRHLLAGHTKSHALGHCSHALGHQVEPHLGAGPVWPSDAGSQEATREYSQSQGIQDSLTHHGEVGQV